MTNGTTTLTCACGRTALRVEGAPIVSAECFCSDCQQAGAVFASLPGVSSPLDDKGGTRFVLYRKDRVFLERGREQLRAHRLSEAATTRRVVAVCCGTPVFLDFAQGHWLSLYGGLWPPATLPALEIRTMTRSRREGVTLPDDVPNPSTHTLNFYWKLLRAWAAMGFRAPKLDFVSGGLDAR